MSFYDYTGVARVAQTTIKKYGGKAELHRRPGKGQEPVRIAKTSAVISTWTSLAAQGFATGGASTTNTSDVAALLPGILKEAPKVNDHFKFGNKTYNVHRVEVVNPSGDTPLLYVLGLE